MTEPETIGWDGYSLPEISEIIARLLHTAAVHRENFEWGDYYLFRVSGGVEHLLVWNEIPPGRSDPDDAAEPEFLSYKCIFWVAKGHESDRLREALLAIPGAKLLRERVR